MARHGVAAGRDDFNRFSKLNVLSYFYLLCHILLIFFSTRFSDSSVKEDLAAVNQNINALHLKVDKILVQLSPDLELNDREDDDIPSLPLVDEDAEERFGRYVEDHQNKVVIVSRSHLTPHLFFF